MATDTAPVHPELEILDQLIAGLEAVIVESDETPLVILASDPPKKAVYRNLSFGVSSDAKKLHPCEAVFLDASRLVLRCPKTEIVRLTPVEVTVNAEKSGRGEAFSIVTGKAASIKRIRGGYEVEVDVTERRQVRITPSQRLRESLARNDAQGWNRWCQDIREGLELVGMDLQNADLQGFDLCCADLSGSDLSGANLTGAILSGANLTHCKLDDATVSGADFFRARMNRNQAGLLPLAGMLEIESVVFES